MNRAVPMIALIALLVPLAAHSAPAAPLLLERLREEQPDVILVGNSMQGEGIDFKVLSQGLGLTAFSAANGGAMSVWHYTVLRHVIPQLEKKPKLVVIIERHNHFSTPQKRARADLGSCLPLLEGQDWSILRRLAIVGEGQPGWERNWDTQFPPLDGFYWDFAKSVNWSLLPFMIQSAREHGFQLVVVRHKSRQFAEQPDWYPPQMQKYTDQMAYYLAAHGVPFIDYIRHPKIEADLYANGDHLNPEGKILWTDLMIADLKAVLTGQRPPNLRLPPDGFEPSPALVAAGKALPVLPEPAPPTPPAVAAELDRIRRRIEEQNQAEAAEAARAGKPPAARQSKGRFFSTLESILQIGKGLRGRGIIMAVAIVPEPASSLTKVARNTSHLDKGGIPVDMVEAFSKADDPQSLFLAPGRLSPRGVELAASVIARQLKSQLDFVDAPLAEYDLAPVTVQTASGQELTLNTVRHRRSGKPVQSAPHTRIVLCGDVNVGLYSDPALGTGAHAGLGEHLTRALGRPVEWRWSDKHPKVGIYEMLDDIHLEKKSVVVWVVMAEQMEGPAWGLLPAPPAKDYDQPGRLIVRAKITTKSPPPEPDLNERYPNTVNYTLWQIHQVVEGEHAAKELLTVEWSQKDMEFLRPFQYQIGDEFTLELIPLSQAMRKNRFIRRADFMDAIQRDDLPPFWVVSHKKH